MPRHAFTILHETLHGPIIAALTTEAGVTRPATYETAAEAEAEIAEDLAAAQEAIATGDRDPDDEGPAADDSVVACIIHDDGSLELPAIHQRWTLAEMLAQHGIR